MIELVITCFLISINLLIILYCINNHNKNISENNKINVYNIFSRCTNLPILFLKTVYILLLFIFILIIYEILSLINGFLADYVSSFLALNLIDYLCQRKYNFIKSSIYITIGFIIVKILKNLI